MSLVTELIAARLSCMVKPAVSRSKTEADRRSCNVRAIRGCSGAARISRVAHERGRPSMLELMPPVGMSGNGIPIEVLMVLRESEEPIVVSISGTS